MVFRRLGDLRERIYNMNFSYSMSLQEALNWVPDNISSYSVLKMQAAPRICRPFTKQDYDPTNYEEEDWDNLIILDACRYDTFEEHNNLLDGELERVYSNASHTSEFLKRNFPDKYQDIVYVSASPQLRGYEDNFYHLEHVWKEGWDDDKNTVLPETMTDRALEFYEDNQDKRLVVHYMQPHWPFIGQKGDGIEGQGSYMLEREKASPWELMYTGKVDREEVIEAYEENLEMVLPEVKRLAEKLDGKTVVTSDHGNLFGERVSFLPLKIYGHPPNLHYSKLAEVPWLELPFDERRNIEAGEIGEVETEEDTEEIKEKLQDLGYLN